MHKEICTLFLYQNTSCRRLRLTLLNIIPVLLIVALSLGGYVRGLYHLGLRATLDAEAKIETSRHFRLVDQFSFFDAMARRMMWTMEFDQCALELIGNRDSPAQLAGIVPVHAISSSEGENSRFRENPSFPNPFYSSVRDSISIGIFSEEISPLIPSGVPCKGFITSHFGIRTDPVWEGSAFHRGIDIANITGSPVWATADGVVIFSGKKKFYGTVVIIDHLESGYRTVYAHLYSSKVSLGDTVSRGSKIAAVGSTGKSTGPHLHYEIRFHDQAIDPLEFMIPPGVVVN